MATKAEQTKKDEGREVPIWGDAENPYGRTNHALSEDEVAALAAAEDNIRPDGRAKHTVYIDDVLADEADRRREIAEARQHGKPAAERLPGETQTAYEARLRDAALLPPRDDNPRPGESQVAHEARMLVHERRERVAGKRE